MSKKRHQDKSEFDLEEVDDKENACKRKSRDFSTDEESECEDGDAPVKVFNRFSLGVWGMCDLIMSFSSPDFLLQ